CAGRRRHTRSPSISWAAADINSGTIWSAGTPTRLTVPAGATIVRISYCGPVDPVWSGVAVLLTYKNGVSFPGALATTFGPAINSQTLCANTAPLVVTG